MLSSQYDYFVHHLNKLIIKSINWKWNYWNSRGLQRSSLRITDAFSRNSREFTRHFGGPSIACASPLYPGCLDYLHGKLCWTFDTKKNIGLYVNNSTVIIYKTCFLKEHLNIFNIDPERDGCFYSLDILYKMIKLK